MCKGSRKIAPGQQWRPDGAALQISLCDVAQGQARRVDCSMPTEGQERAARALHHRAGGRQEGGQDEALRSDKLAKKRAIGTIIANGQEALPHYGWHL